MAKQLSIDDIFARCMPIPECGCWVWMGPDNGKPNDLAHGKLRANGVLQYVHRFVYQLMHDKIKPERHVHHECSVRMCCNPDHLTEVYPIHNHLLGRGVETQFRSDADYAAERQDAIEAFDLA